MKVTLTYTLRMTGMHVVRLLPVLLYSKNINGIYYIYLESTMLRRHTGKALA